MSRPTPGQHATAHNPLRAAVFTHAAAKPEQMPADAGAEVAFAGRSNAGKSSALNALTEQKALARTSKTPGRTQLIVSFEVSATARLVDLPGYGFAKVPQAMRLNWEREVTKYLERRASLKALVLAMDSRHPLKEMDQVVIDWAAAGGLPLLILLTKADKLSRNQAAQTLAAVRRELTAHHPGAEVQLFSALKGSGVAQARERVLSWLGLAGDRAGMVGED